MKTGFCTISASDLTVTEAITVAAEAGFDGVEIWGRDHIADGSDATIESIRNFAAEKNLEIPVYGSYLRPGSTDYNDAVQEELEIARSLGVSLVRVWAGDQSYPDRTEEHWEAVVTDLIDLSERAEEYGLGITVEHHANTLTETTAGARRLLKAVDRDNCQLNWQPSFGRSAEDILESARELAPLSNNIHIQATPDPDRSWQDRCLLEEAYFDIPAIIETFEETGFDGYIEVEFLTENLDLEAAARKDAEYLHSILEQ